MEQETGKDLTLTQRPNLSLTISKAVSEGKPVKQLINEGFSQKTIDGALAARIAEASSMLHIGGNLASGESIKIAQMLIGEYPTASMDDFSIMLQRGITGRYGKVYGFDISIVFGWMAGYMGEWAEEKEKQLSKERNKLSESIEPEPGQWSPETEKLVREFQESLADHKKVPSMSMKEIREEGQERPKERRASSYIPNPELVVMHEKRMQWIRETHDPITGKAYELSLTFEEWLNQNQ